MILHRRARRGARRGVADWLLVVFGGALAGGAALVTALVRGGDTNAAITVALAVLAGAMIGLAAAWIVGRRTALVRSRRDLEKLSSAPNLAVIPRHPLDAERPDDVVMIRDPNSIDAEAYRGLRTSFEFVAGRADGVPGRGFVVLVTSPRPGEGKSSVAANLAAASAMASRRVVLVDGDLRKPQVHRLFRLGNDAGLVTLLAGESTLHDAVQHLDGIDHLVVLSAGPPPPDPAEVLSGSRLARLMSTLAAACDLVVVDAPPLLAVTDPAIIAQQCDGVLMVATADFSSKREWTEALARLAVVDAKVIGTVLLEPDDRIRAVPTYRYAPSTVPQNWWVSPDAPLAESGLRVVGGTAGDSVRDEPGTSRADHSDDWPEHPTGH